jgi:hypothetical protein
MSGNLLSRLKRTVVFKVIPVARNEWQETGADTPASIALRRIIRQALDRDITRPVCFFLRKL